MREQVTLKSILKANLSFLNPYFLFLLLGAVFIAFNTKAHTHLILNSFHTSFFDVFFYYITFLGDGIMPLLVGIILFAVKYRYVLIVGVSNIVASIITQLLKRTLFESVVRPKKFFEGLHDLYLVPGVENYSYNSFPSGHATCAFALYFSLALIVNRKNYKILLCTTALLVGYSRIYLSQHFFEDVYVGSIIGVITSIIVFYIIQKSNRSWLDKSLVSIFK